MTNKINALFILLAAAVGVGEARAENKVESTELSPKVFVRMSGGMISNVGTSSGSTITYGGANLGVVYYFTQQMALGAAYKAETTFGSIPLKGVDLFGRYYFLGLGTAQKSTDSSGNRILKQSPWAMYGGLEFSQRSFNFELDPEAILADDRSVSGNISSANIIIGYDHHVNRNWEFNAETSYTVLPFGGNDPRVKIKWILFSIGAAYVF